MMRRCQPVLAAVAVGLAIALPAPAVWAVPFTVTKTADTNDGVCDADCSLREAIATANATPGADTVTVPVGNYLTGGGFAITDSVEVAGAGADVTIVNGNASGAVFIINSGTVELADLTIRNGAPNFVGGGIENRSDLTVERCVIRDNQSMLFTAGGGIYNDGSLVLQDSTVTNNRASFFGAGILGEVGSTMTIVNSSITDNIGDGVTVGGMGTIVSTTITGNTDAGLNVFGVGPTRIATIANTIIAANGTDCSNSAQIISAGYNLSSGSSCSPTGPGDQQNTAANLAPLGDYGGSTLTQAPCSGAGAPHPSCTAVSAAIDAANPAVPGSGGFACPAADQRGVARGATRCDVGAHEVVCGDGLLDGGEECDDANALDGDGCDSNCTVTGCGNGVLTSGEECDDGNTVDIDGCTQSCTTCGNGMVSAPETCDDANLVSDDGCDANCTTTGCGNGVVTTGEQCDDRNSIGGDCCDAVCQLEAAASPCTDDGFGCTSDLCDGAGTCVHDLRAAGATCRATAGVCDLAETCDGAAPACPTDTLRSAFDLCRPAGGACDVQEFCSGASAACPPDFKRTTECRAATGFCDPAESCDGSSNACPADQYLPDGTTCDDGNPASDGDVCDVGACSGTLPPPDAMKCYLAKTALRQRSSVPMQTADQFEDKRSVVTRALALCNPVAVNGAPIANPADHLTCYRVRDAAGEPAFVRRQIETTDRFGTVRLELRKPVMLCLRSSSSILP
jgi:CSLREA domain-containing protein